MRINTKEATLFLVEDDDVDAMAIQRSLKKNNINNPIIRAYDGFEAYQMLLDEKVPKPEGSPQNLETIT